jgi:hypothetical protein
MDHIWSTVVAAWYAAARHGVPVDCWALWSRGAHLSVGAMEAVVVSETGHPTELVFRGHLTEPNPYEPDRFKLADFAVAHAIGSQATRTVLTDADGTVEYEGGIIWSASTYLTGAPEAGSAPLSVQFRWQLSDVLMGPHATA